MPASRWPRRNTRCRQSIASRASPRHLEIAGFFPAALSCTWTAPLVRELAGRGNPGCAKANMSTWPRMAKPIRVTLIWTPTLIVRWYCCFRDPECRWVRMLWVIGPWIGSWIPMPLLRNVFPTPTFVTALEKLRLRLRISYVVPRLQHDHRVQRVSCREVRVHNHYASSRTLVQDNQRDTSEKNRKTALSATFARPGQCTGRPSPAALPTSSRPACKIRVKTCHSASRPE
jgi:hypothetical protein